MFHFTSESTSSPTLTLRVPEALTLCALAILTLASCDGSPTGARGQLSGTFELTRMDRGELPFLLWQESVRTMVLTGEELEFSPDGTVVRTSWVLDMDLSTNAETASETSWESEYRIQGRTIQIGRFDPCPPNAFCIPNDVGLLGKGRLEVQSGLWGAVGEYRRR